MTTGKVEFAPDYKSSKPVRRGDRQLIEAAQRIWNDSEAAKERARLERETIDAAKAERIAAKDYKARLVMENWKRSVDTRSAREAAVDALIDFESQQSK